MKYIVLLCDGAADYPCEQLGGLTPLSKSVTPNMDKLAQVSELGLVKTVADGMKPGSDVANLSVLGYDPDVCYTGRSPLEAGSIGIDMAEDDVSFRCNLVTLSDEDEFDQKTMVDYCSDDISTAEAKELIEYLAQHINNEHFTLYSGVSYRHCLIWHKGTLDVGTLTPPHDISGRKITEYVPEHPNAQVLYDMMKKSVELLKDHPVNKARIERGLRPATSMWLWGEGKRANLDNFEGTHGIKASMISAVDLLKGIGKFAGMNVVEVEGATGYIDTNFIGKADAALKELENGQDFVYVHMEAPDECGHRAETDNKVRSLEIIDKDVLGRMLPVLDEKYDDYKIMILPDHPTPLALKTHTNDPVPYMIYQKSVKRDGQPSYNEETGKAAGNYIAHGPDIMKHFIEM